MAINSYSELQDAVSNWLNRTDLSVRVPEFIALAEARFRRELREWLRTSIALTNITGDTALAATVDAVLGVAYADGTRHHSLGLLTWNDYHEWMARDASVRSPAAGVYVDRDEMAGTTTLRFYPPASAGSPITAVSVYCVGYLPALRDSAPTNRLLAVASDVYLFGSLAESAPYLQHDERLGMWESRAAQGIKGLIMQTERKMFGGQPRPAKLPVVLG
jgi:hypothetical protein